MRVAIIGAGPAGFFVADHLLSQGALTVEVDVFDRLPNPFGLVRSGVAPDHQKIKRITRVFDRVARRPNFRFFGNVTFGEQLTLDDLRRHYHQVVFATGAQTDRRLGIPGEHLAGSHSATAFVAWYNGHPDYRHLRFDLSHERVAVIGMGNVALDVARILCRTPEELEQTDIAPYALEALRQSRVREVIVLGRRGPAQAAFSLPEARELDELEDAEVIALPEETRLDTLSRKAVELDPRRSLVDKVDLVQTLASEVPTDKHRTLVLRFLVSPVEIQGDDNGRVTGVRLVRNELFLSDDGQLRARATDVYEDLPVGLVFRSVGYRGVALPDVPFDAKRGTVPHEAGRVVDPATGRPVPGLYVSGWIKRGASGTIGTNKPDAAETVASMLADLARGRHLRPSLPDGAAVERLIRGASSHPLSYAEWQRIDELEVALGTLLGRPRIKLSRKADILAALGLQHDCYVCGRLIEDEHLAYIVCRVSKQPDDPTVLTVKKCCLERLEESSGNASMLVRPFTAAIAS